MRSLEERIIEIEDRLAIQELHNKYVQGQDKKDEALYMSIWDENAKVDMGSYGSASGSAEILAQLKGVWDMLPTTRHIMGNVVIDYNGDKASSVSDVFSTAWAADGTPLVSYATYRDKLIKKDGKWLIIDRLVDISYSAPVTEVWKLVKSQD